MMMADSPQESRSNWRTMASSARRAVLLLFTLMFSMATLHGHAQTAAADQQTATPPVAPSASLSPLQKDCIEPEPVFTGLEYNGPFKKLVVRVAGKPEIKTVHQHEGEGRICTLPVRKKFNLFVRDTFEPFTFAISGFNAGVAQASNDDPTFGQGMEGFGRRYGAAFADHVSGDFFGTFLFPTVLHEDPRYYRKGHGSTGGRLMHAVGHTFITYRDSGN